MPEHMTPQEMANEINRLRAVETENARLRGIIARFAASRLLGENGKLYVTPGDIHASLEILSEEKSAGRFTI